MADNFNRGSIEDELTALGDAASQQVAGTVMDKINALTGNLTSAKNAFMTGMQDITAAAQGAADGFANGAAGLKSTVGGFQNAAKNVAGSVQSTVDGLQGSITGLTTGAGSVRDAVAGLTTGVGSVRDAVAGLTNTADNLVSSVKGIAGNVNGAIQGVKAAASGVQAAASGIAFNASVDTATKIANLTPYNDLSDLFLDPVTGFKLPDSVGQSAVQTGMSINRSSVTNSGAGHGRIHASYKTETTAFSHNANSDTVSLRQETSKGLNTAFVPNILDNYDVVTYHWKLFIVDPESTSRGEILGAKSQTIIAETGVTDYTITKVEIGGVVTPSMESGTGTATSVNIEIVEPSGASMLDKLFYEAIALGVGNWAVMPLYLQLSFKTRELDTSNTPNTESVDELSSLKWIWPLKISGTKAFVSHTGTRYELTAIPYSELTQSNLNFVLQHNVKLEEIGTFEDAIRELENKLNIDQLFKTTNNYSKPDLYQFFIDPELFSYKISTGNNADSTRANSMHKLSVKDATFNSGTSIDKIIDTLLSHTEEYQKSLIGAKSPGAEGSPAEETPAMKKFWRVVTDARPVAFDPRRQDDSKVFSIYVVRYDLGTADANVFQQSNSKNYDTVERKRLMTYLNNKILKKKYNYIFTGLNDQIIDLDLKLSNAFAVAMTRMSGVYTNLAMSDKGVVNQENAKLELEVTSKMASYVALKNSAKYANSNKTAESLVAAQRAIEDSTLTPERKEQLRKMLEQHQSGSRLDVQRRIMAGHGTLDGSGTVKFVSNSLVEEVGGRRFVSDVDLTDPATISRYKDFLEATKGKLRPIARVETTQDRQIGNGLESASNSGLQKLSSMYSTALAGYDEGFIKVQMTIKGDPFWLFPAPISDESERPAYISLMDPQKAVEWIKTAHIKKASTANFFSTDNFIVLRFRTPRIYQDDTAAKVDSGGYDEVHLFSGVYRIIQLVSKFEGGKFTQELDCVIDNEIDLRNFVKEIEDVVRQPDTAATVSDLKAQIPEANIKRSRITGNDRSAPEGVDTTPVLSPLASADVNPLSTVTSGIAGNSGINNRRIL